VILHGLFGSGRNWRGIAKALSPHSRVYCVDMRNHGQSPWTTTMTYPEMAGDVRMLIESEGLDKPVVIGHSMGGKAAMMLALETPSVAGRLILIDIAPVSYVNDQFSANLEEAAFSLPANSAITHGSAHAVEDITARGPRAINNTTDRRNIELNGEQGAGTPSPRCSREATTKRSEARCARKSASDAEALQARADVSNIRTVLKTVTTAAAAGVAKMSRLRRTSRPC
jgi:pimeloyl-ACP methyl ester carboxylesterase